ncbi:carbohydrate ABC transporter permease [Nonomuraea candida]|uniref:carbohydrate ABC transporter permease n=1 Tax=Nonomuraea candida TaxID=359159 RepID=UPI0005BAB032|nr:carbohydrate ABC transporter permease [Nonomuraea candida]
MTTAFRHRPPRAGAGRAAGLVPTALLLVGAVYCLFPVVWVLIAATKSPGELFTTSTLSFGTGFLGNVSELFAYRDGVFWWWAGNTLLYAGGGALLSTAVSAISGYTLAKYRFPGRDAIFTLLIGGILVPAVVLAIPQYLLFSKIGLADTYAAVLLPQILHPYGIYLARVYAAAAVPDSLLEAGGRCRARRGGPGGGGKQLPRPLGGVDQHPHHREQAGGGPDEQQGANQPSLYNLILTGAFLSIIPLIALFLTMQRYWKTDLSSGALK